MSSVEELRGQRVKVFSDNMNVLVQSVLEVGNTKEEIFCKAYLQRYIIFVIAIVLVYSRLGPEVIK